MSASSALTTAQLQELAYYLGEKEGYRHQRVGELLKETTGEWLINRILFRPDDQRLNKILMVVTQSFQKLEERGIKCFDETIKPEISDAYYSRFAVYNQVFTQLEDIIKNQSNKQHKHRLNVLKLHVFAMQYRLEISKSNSPQRAQEPAEAALNKLVDWAKKYKERESKSDKDINDLEMEQLRQAARYPEWVDTIEKNPRAIREFMCWAVRDYNPVEPFILFPSTRKKLAVSLLSCDLGYSRVLGDETLRLEKVATKTAGVFKWILTLPIYEGSFTTFEPEKQRRFNILKDSTQIYFSNGNYHLTVKEFLAIRAQNRYQEPNIILVAHWGFTNFHPVKGPFNAITQKYHEKMRTAWKNDPVEWIDKVPPRRIIQHEEVVARFGDKVNNLDLFYEVSATRTKLDLNVLDCHGYWQFYKKYQDGAWHLLTPGVFAYRFSQSTIDGVTLLAHTVDRVVCVHDQNPAFTQRQRAHVVKYPNENQSKVLLTKIHDYMTNEGAFQFSGYNCAYSVQESTNEALEPEIPQLEQTNYFRAHCVEGDTGISIFDAYFAFCRRLWPRIQKVFTDAIAFILGGWRSRTYGDRRYSIGDYRKEQGPVIFNPSYLHHQILLGKIKGLIIWGNTENRFKPHPIDTAA